MKKPKKRPSAMFADTDFILALIKDSDWIKENAMRLLNSNKGRIRTSVSVMIEMAIICKRLKINALEAFANIFELVGIDDDTCTICMRAATYMEKYGLNVFDAFHAAYCNDGKIISSDSAYDRVGIERIKLEKLAHL